MNGELNFEAMPLEAYDGFRTLASEQSGFELEEELGRRARSQSRRQGFVPPAPWVMPKRPGTPAVFRPGKPKKPPFPPPRLPPFPPRSPGGVVGGPYGLAPEPYSVVPEPFGAAPEPPPAEPLPAGSEYMRWVQSALNDVLGLRLPVHGIADAATRSAIRSFQQREGLPADGVGGPDTERALLAARGGMPPQRFAPGPAGPSEPAPAATAGEFNFEWENFEQEVDDTRKNAERAAVKSRVEAGQRDRNALTDMVFFQRHPERRGRPLRADEYKLVEEWKAILRNVVLPELVQAPAQPATGAKISDSDVAATQAMAAKPVPKLGISLEELLLRHRAEAGGIPIELLLAFIFREAGTNRRGEAKFNDATAGYRDKKTGRYVPSPKFYELGLFQTPAGLHGCVPAGDKGMQRSCKYNTPPGHDVEKSSFGHGWWLFTRTYPNESNWTNPDMQVRIGLWNLNSPADMICNKFMALFPSKQTEWFLRMAVLYSFAAGAGWTRAFLGKYRNELLALPEGQRWDFLRGKQASRINPETKKLETKVFNPENVDNKMALAAKLRAVRRTIT
jgi:peptidoglycan hydrolase-like protein with peptidoglycan-binding domain